MGSFGVRVIAFNTNAFLADENHQPTQTLGRLQSIYCSLYESGVMLDKVTKACYNFIVLFIYVIFLCDF
ncbi:hypothetical protein AM497_04625 [Helicobacter pylori]|uniref:hypothetical protein n=1 Tax=Helicobacter pylori TaxID=210 RepID=UPI0006AEA531|nr:hypothetical protein [Helicobacter pylori]KOS33012.1 hypothetical protein AM497_04625 [Helicobacter pylori]